MSGVEGFMYPNEVTLNWSVLIVLYPYITGLVAGAWFLASLERVFRVEAVKPTYRLALLTALFVSPCSAAATAAAPGAPRAFARDVLHSAQHFRHGHVRLCVFVVPDGSSDASKSGSTTGATLSCFRKRPKVLLRLVYKIMSLGSNNISERSLHIDERVGWIVTLVGIPSAFLLHGYVGFIFGSIKANPWWSSPLMPVVFIFSAMVSGIACVMVLYMATTKVASSKIINMQCVDTIAMYLFYTFVIDFSLEMLDLVPHL